MDVHRGKMSEESQGEDGRLHTKESGLEQICSPASEGTNPVDALFSKTASEDCETCSVA